jgi:hypothetical protein
VLPTSPLVRGTLRALWAGAGTEEGIVHRTVQLPRGTGEPTAMALADGFLVVGTRTGHLFLLNALFLDKVLDTVELPHPVVAAEVVEASGQQYRAVPALVVTTERAVFRLDLLPTPGVTRLWEAPTSARCAAPAIPVGEGILAFHGANGRTITGEWLALDGSGSESLGDLEGPLGRPLRLPGGQVFTHGPGTAYLFTAGSPGRLQSRAVRHQLDPSIPGAYLEPTGEVFLAFHGDGGYGLVRFATAEMEAWTCGDTVYKGVQIMAVDRRSIAVASTADLEFRNPLTGERTWSMKDQLHRDTLDQTRFQPMRTEGHMLLTAQAGGHGSMVLLMPLSREALREGPRRIAEGRHPVLPPLALPSGVVVAEYADGVAHLVIAQPRETAS